MNPDGTEVTRLTNNSDSESNPEWSPDSTRISFDASSTDGGSCCSRNIYVMNADGTDRQRLTTTPDVIQGQDFQATWAPDGTQITFTSLRSGQYDIWAVDAPPPPTATTLSSFSADTALAASTPRNLTAGPGPEAHDSHWGTLPPGGGNSCTIKGTRGDDTLTGTPDADVICGMRGNDEISARGGDDVLRGETGINTLKGGTGTDTADYAPAGVGVAVDLKSGTAAGPATDILSSIEKVRGTGFSDNIAGNGANNILIGGHGNDNLHGRAGDDTLRGGDGDDDLHGGTGTDTCKPGAGTNNTASCET